MLAKDLGSLARYTSIAERLHIRAVHRNKWLLCRVVDSCHNHIGQQRPAVRHIMQANYGDILVVPRYLAGRAIVVKSNCYVSFPYSHMVHLINEPLKTVDFQQPGAATAWFESGKYAQINGTRVRPVEHPVLKDELLSIQKGQAESICLVREDGSKRTLKKFHQGKALDRGYLVSVSTLLPKVDGFVAGTQRQVLSSDTLTKTTKCYYAKDLAAFFQDTVLMPHVKGTDWSGLADELREGHIQLTKNQRIGLCRTLTELIAKLENNNCSHRDISSGNAHIDTTTWKIYLIDFDSFYHPSLSMPKATTCGTAGYTPPFARQAGVLDARRTWCLHADRWYALGILIAEFCILDRGSPLTSEGGMFNQDELRVRSGSGLDAARKTLHAQWPAVVSMFDATIKSRDFESCPSPQNWQKVFDGAFVEPPSLAHLESIPADYFQKILSMRRPAIPVWSPPYLSEIPEFKPKKPKAISKVVVLPPGPWN